MGDILGYCDFHKRFGIPSRVSRRELFGSKQLACTRVTGLTNHSELACADHIIQEVGVPAALSMLHEWRDLQRRLNIQRLHIRNTLPVFRAEIFPVPVISMLVFATVGERDFEYKCASPDLGLLQRV